MGPGLALPDEDMALCYQLRENFTFEKFISGCFLQLSNLIGPLLSTSCSNSISKSYFGDGEGGEGIRKAGR